MTVLVHPNSKAGMRAAGAQPDGSVAQLGTLPLGGVAKRRVRGRRAAVRAVVAVASIAGVVCTLAAGHARAARMWRRALHWYLRELHVRPLVARTLSAGLIFFIADLLAQRLSARGTSARMNVARLARYTAYGAFVMAPFLFAWYTAMNAYAPRDDAASAFAKCLFEQLTLEPFCIVMYIAYDGILCQRGWRAVTRRTRSAFVPLWFKNAVFWMPANFSNYYIATPDLRVVFANLCSLFWNAYFSSKINVPIANTRRSLPGTPGKYASLADAEQEA